MNRYHLHLYFDPSELEGAQQLARQATESGLFDLVAVQPRAVGPHPKGMIEAHFLDSRYTDVVEWVERHRASRSALLHLDSGDDHKDHTTGARWLGPELPLDFSFFELIQRKPHFRIHR